MIKYLFVGLIVMFIYRFWNSKETKPEKKEPEIVYQEPDEFTDYEELD